MQLHFCGGAGEVGASCALVTLGERRILVDCGMRMKGDSLPDLSTLQAAGGADAIVLTHAHMDHSGSLPVVSEAFPRARIYMTPPTLALIRVLLYDSLKIMAQEEEIPTYDRDQVERMLGRAAPLGFEDTAEIAGGVRLTFSPAGHILGAASAYLASSAGSVFFSGDLSKDPQRTVSGLSVPRLRPRACVLEATYGDRLHTDRKVEEARLIESVRERVQESARILLPSFAVGRAQEVILILRAAIRKGQLPEFPIYVDGMVREVCRIYRQFPNYLREPLAKRVWRGEDVFFSDPVRAVSTPEERREIVRQKGPYCIISSSGMLSGGPSAFYAAHLAADPAAYIAVTGYQDEESPGRKLQQVFRDGAAAIAGTGTAAPTWSIGGREVPLRCRLGTFGLSAHADSGQLLALADHLAPKQVYLVHGDPKVLAAFGPKMQASARRQVHIPSNGAAYVVESRAGLAGAAAGAGVSAPPRLPGAELDELAAHLLRLGAAGPWTARELLCIAGQEGELSAGQAGALSAEQEGAMIRRLNESRHFECDPRRLYLFHAVEAAAPESGGPMEVNQMLALARERFPAESGCYKTGARVDQHVARLSFRFPGVAVQRFGEAFKAFEQETGWTLELNEHPDTSYLPPLLAGLMEGMEGMDAQATKVAYHPDRGRVEVTLVGSAGQDLLAALKERFRTETGLELGIDPRSDATAGGIDPGGVAVGQDAVPMPGGPAIEGGPLLNQQEAMAWVARTFEAEGVRVFRQSVKADAQGKYLEIQFMTPIVGQWQADLIETLRIETGWRILWSRHPRQGELIEEARRRCEQAGLRIAKGPSILAHGAVRVKTIGVLESARQDALRQAFFAVSGYELELIES